MSTRVIEDTYMSERNVPRRVAPYVLSNFGTSCSNSISAGATSAVALVCEERSDTEGMKEKEERRGEADAGSSVPHSLH